MFVVSNSIVLHASCYVSFDSFRSLAPLKIRFWISTYISTYVQSHHSDVYHFSLVISPAPWSFFNTTSFHGFFFPGHLMSYFLISFVNTARDLSLVPTSTEPYNNFGWKPTLVPVSQTGPPIQDWCCPGIYPNGSTGLMLFFINKKKISSPAFVSTCASFSVSKCQLLWF